MNGQFSLTKPIAKNEILRKVTEMSALPEDPESKDQTYVSWFLGSVGTTNPDKLRRCKSANQMLDIKPFNDNYS